MMRGKRRGGGGTRSRRSRSKAEEAKAHHGVSGRHDHATIHHEDVLAIQKANMGYLIFPRRTGPKSIIEAMSKASRKRNEDKTILPFR